VATKGPAIIPPKALRILVRICSQVPAKVQSALLVACVRSLEGRREGESKKQTTHQKTKTKLSAAIAMSWTGSWTFLQWIGRGNLRKRSMICIV
jgi:hypothetical protein